MTEDQQSPSGQFRPDLEGLRALAVGLVVLFHASAPGFSGGYIGVDVFYVLSGFFITGLLLRERDRSGRVDLPAFFGRRFKRLVPAAALVLVATLLGCWLLVDPLSRRDFAWDALASAWDVSNIRFALRATDYLASTEAPSPFLHYWSLAVETQFYLLWPALLSVAAGRHRRPPSATRRRLAFALGGVVVMSLGVSVWATTWSQPMAFFMLPTRAWELAVGGLVSLVPAHVLRRGWLGPSCFATGVICVGAAGIFYTTGTPFPGWAAVLPVVGTALVIVANQQAGVGRLLVNPLASFVGRISYSLYLWHWPGVVLATAAIGHAIPVWGNVIVMAGATGLAWLTFTFVEDPMRKLTWPPARSLAVVGGMSAAASAVALTMVLTPLSGGPPGPVPALRRDQLPAVLEAGMLTRPVPANLTPSLDRVRESLPAVYAAGCHQAMDSVGMPECVFGDAGGTTSVWLVGDSHAAQWFPALALLARQRGWKLVSHTYSNCPPTSSLLRHPRRPGFMNVRCRDWQTQLLAAIRLARPSLVVTSAAAVLLTNTMPGFEQRLMDFARAAGRVAVLGDGPRHARDVPACVSAHMDDAAACSTNRLPATADNRRADMAAAARAAGVAYVDTTEWVCTPEACPVIIENVLLFRDNSHLTPQAVEFMTPLIDVFLRDTLERQER